MVLDNQSADEWLMAVIIREATTSPRTNLLAPSISPPRRSRPRGKPRLTGCFLASLVRKQSGCQVRVNGHLLAGHGVQGESRGYFSDYGWHPLVITMKLMMISTAKMNNPDDEIALSHESAEALDHLSGVTSFGQDEAGCGRCSRKTGKRVSTLGASPGGIRQIPSGFRV